MLGLFMSASRFDTDDLDDLDDLDNPQKHSKGGLLQFVKGAFRVFVEILFWIIPIGGAIVGGILGRSEKSSYSDDRAIYTFYGVVIGLVVGILIDIIYGGITATLLAIEENTAKTEENTAEMLEVLKKNAKVDDTFERRGT
jgi:hypothetical protein